MFTSMEVITISMKDPRIIDGIANFFGRIGLYKELDRWPIVEGDENSTEVVAYCMVIQGFTPLVRFLAYATDYRGRDVHREVFVANSVTGEFVRSDPK